MILKRILIFTLGLTLTLLGVIMAIKVHPFELHQYGCMLCTMVHIENPFTLVRCCLIGAPLLRDYLVEINSKEYKSKQKSLKREFISDADGKSYKTTSTKLKRVMVYKE
jgi:hypothetical protein